MMYFLELLLPGIGANRRTAFPLFVVCTTMWQTGYTVNDNVLVWAEQA